MKFKLLLRSSVIIAALGLAYTSAGAVLNAAGDDADLRVTAGNVQEAEYLGGAAALFEESDLIEEQPLLQTAGAESLLDSELVFFDVWAGGELVESFEEVISEVPEVEGSISVPEPTPTELPTATPTPTEATTPTEAPTPTEEPTPADEQEENGDTDTEDGAAKGAEVASFACQFVGNPYVYGGTSLTDGADCSGFVMSVYKNFGVALPRSSGDYLNAAYAVENGLDGARAGDIICYRGHVAIYIGNGQIVHAYNSRKGIAITEVGYDTVIGVRRVFR